MSGGSIKGYINYGGCNKFNGRYISSSLFNKNEYYYKLIIDNNISYTYIKVNQEFMYPIETINLPAPILKGKLFISIGNNNFTDIYNDVIILPSLYSRGVNFSDANEAILTIGERDIHKFYNNLKKLTIIENEDDINEKILKNYAESLTDYFINYKAKTFVITNCFYPYEVINEFDDFTGNYYNEVTYTNSFINNYINSDKIKNLYKNRITNVSINGFNKKIEYLGNFIDKNGTKILFGITTKLGFDNETVHENPWVVGADGARYSTYGAEYTMGEKTNKLEDCFTNFDIIKNYLSNPDINKVEMDKEYKEGLTFKEMAGKTFIYKFYKGG